MKKKKERIKKRENLTYQLRPGQNMQDPHFQNEYIDIMACSMVLKNTTNITKERKILKIFVKSKGCPESLYSEAMV